MASDALVWFLHLVFFMAITGRFGVILAVAALIVSAISCVLQPPLQSSAEEAAVQGFIDRVKAYDKLRDEAEDAVGDLDDDVKAGELVRQEHALAAEIRRRRQDAVRGEIFTLDIETVIGRILAQVSRGEGGTENVAAIRDEWPAAITLEVNREYPDEKPLSRVPADVLRVLPKLPTGIQYRFVPKHLVLYDARADVIIDYMPVSLGLGV